MKIELSENNEFSILLTDEFLDNDNFVELRLEETTITVSLDELIAAANSFAYKRKMRIIRESKMS